MERTIFVASTPLQKKKTPKERVLEKEGAAAKAKGRQTDLCEHLVTEGNSVWTSGNRGLHCVTSILLAFLLCLAVYRLGSCLYMLIGWREDTFIHFL